MIRSENGCLTYTASSILGFSLDEWLENKCMPKLSNLLKRHEFHPKKVSTVGVPKEGREGYKRIMFREYKDSHVKLTLACSHTYWVERNREPKQHMHCMRCAKPEVI